MFTPKPKRKCLTPSCYRSVERRGVCGPCGARYLQMVRTGRSTWDLLEALGKVRPDEGDSRDKNQGA